MMPEFQVPAYAQQALWLTDAQGWQVQPQADQAADLEGVQFPLTLRWAHPQGSPLFHWQNLPKRLRWQGALQVTGYTERSHLLTVGDLELMVLEIMGYVEPAPRFPSLTMLQKTPYTPDFYRASDDTAPSWYSFLLPLDSPFADFAQQSLFNNHSVTCYGALAAEKSNLHQLIGMPFLLNGLTFHVA